MEETGVDSIAEMPTRNRTSLRAPLETAGVLRGGLAEPTLKKTQEKRYGGETVPRCLQ